MSYNIANMRKSNLKLFIQEHKCLFLSNVVSLFLGIIPFLFFVFCFDLEDKILAFLFLLPCIFVFCISYYATKTSSKYPKITNKTACILNIAIIVILQCFVALWYIFLFSLYLSDKMYDNPKDYNNALKNINYTERIAHFPMKIPTDASDIELYKTSNSIFGSETICLKFRTNSKYIEDELKKYHFVNQDTPPNYKYKYDYILNNYSINIDGFTFYIIGHQELYDNIKNKYYYPYHYGIGINKSKNQIIYYYTYPD